VFPNAGGSYSASSYGSFDLFKEATGTDDVATNPEVTIHFEAGAWGSGGNEPMVFAYVRSLFDSAGEAEYLRPPIPTVGYARVPCTRDVDPHCECIRPDPDECYHFTIAAAVVERPYRLVNMSGMTLPANVSLIPVLVDYNVHMGIDGTPQVLPENQPLFRLSALVDLRYPTRQSYVFRALNCTADLCTTREMNPAPSEGSFEMQVPVGAAEELVLSVTATVSVNDSPNCTPVTTLPNDPCLVLPYSGDAWVHVDPYVYVDPSWEYADWFEVQTTPDGVEWFAVTRTAVDLSTFGLEGGNGVPDGGVPDPDAGAGGVGGTAGSGGTPGTGGGGNPSNGDGGGCSVTSVLPASESNLALLVLFVVGAVIRRRRRRCSGNEL
jgi:MYXO-CTERM domain-containing protein